MTPGQAVSRLFTPRWSYAPRANQADYMELFHTSPRLDPVDAIATDVANSKFKIFPKQKYLNDPDTTEEIKDHPFFMLWDNPMPDHPEIDGFYMRYLTQVYFELFGECFWVLDGKAKPTEAYIVPSIWVLFTPTLTAP